MLGANENAEALAGALGANVLIGESSGQHATGVAALDANSRALAGLRLRPALLALTPRRLAQAACICRWTAPAVCPTCAAWSQRLARISPEGRR